MSIKPAGPVQQSNRVYTEDAFAQLAEILTTDPEIPEAIRSELQLLLLAFDYRTLSTTFLHKNTIQNLMIRLEMVKMKAIMYRPDLVSNSKYIETLDAFITLVKITSQRSEEGWLMTKLAGFRLTGLQDAKIRSEDKKPWYKKW